MFVIHLCFVEVKELSEEMVIRDVVDSMLSQICQAKPDIAVIVDEADEQVSPLVNNIDTDGTSTEPTSSIGKLMTVDINMYAFICIYKFINLFFVCCAVSLQVGNLFEDDIPSYLHCICFHDGNVCEIISFCGKSVCIVF